MKKLAQIIAFFLLVTPAMAQQRPQYSQYIFNNFLLNPALSGIESYTDLRMGMRKQWVGIEGAPTTYYISGHTSFGMSDHNAPQSKFSKQMKVSSRSTTKYHKSRPHHGFGAMAQADQTGPLKTSNVALTYAYHHPLTRRVNMSVGMSAGALQNRLDPNMLHLVNENDPSLQLGRMANTKFDMAVGTWIYSDFFYVGASATQIFPDKKTVNNDGYATFDMQPHFFLTGGYRIRVRYDLTVEPSVMIKMAQPSPIAVDMNFKATYADRFWAGVSYRHKDAVAALAGLNVNYLLDVGYSYDLTTSALNNVSSGSHEIILGFKLRNKTRMLCPQWLW